MQLIGQDRDMWCGFRLHQLNLEKQALLCPDEIFQHTCPPPYHVMETLAAIGLVGNIVQFVDFSQKLISNSIQLYHSYDGALAENIDVETVTNDLLILNKKLKDDATTVGDGALQSLCLCCEKAGEDLVKVLNKVKVKDRQKTWESVKKALRSIWIKAEIKGLEKRLAKFKEELNLHIIMGLRYVI
jgi:hypothetical protein